MKAAATMAAMACALTVAAPAAAGTNEFSGSVTNNGKKAGAISFKVTTDAKGKATKVSAIKLKDLTVACVDYDKVTPNGDAQSTLTKISATLPGSATIKTSAFRGRSFNIASYRRKVAGRSWNVSISFTSTKGTKVKAGSVNTEYKMPGVANGRCVVPGGTGLKVKKK